ncbi:MAG: SdpI family protein [Ruthenibacterium sp.]
MAAGVCAAGAVRRLWRSRRSNAHAVLAGRQVNRLGSKPEFLLLCAAGPALTALLAFVPRIDPHRENYRNLQGATACCGWPALFYLLAACSVRWRRCFRVFRQVPVSRLMLATGPLFCVIGNFMPKFRHNYFCGIKSPWALANEENWRRTHRFAGPLWFWGGLGVAVLSFVLPQAAMFAASFAVFLALAVVPFVYSYILYKKAHANTRGS